MAHGETFGLFGRWWQRWECQRIVKPLAFVGHRETSGSRAAWRSLWPFRVVGGKGGSGQRIVRPSAFVGWCETSGCRGLRETFGF